VPLACGDLTVTRSISPGGRLHVHVLIEIERGEEQNVAEGGMHFDAEGGKSPYPATNEKIDSKKLTDIKKS